MRLHVGVPSLLLLSSWLFCSCAIQEKLFEFSAGPLVDTRLDPVVNPGTCSGHVHSVFGGADFKATISPDDLIDDDWRNSTGKQLQTTANVIPNKSLYWSPAMYIKAGDYFFLVKSYARLYYRIFFQGEDWVNIEPFPLGLRMLLGNASRMENFNPNNTGDDIAWVWRRQGANNRKLARAQKYGDWQYLKDIYDDPNATNDYFEDIEMNARFTPCLALVDPSNSSKGPMLDSSNHRDHMAYADRDVCPDTHPFQMPTLEVETRYRIRETADDLVEKMGYNWTAALETVINPYNWVLSTGDTSGGGAHTDFVSGWPEELMREIIWNCRSDSGAPFNRTADNPCPITEFYGEFREAETRFTVPFNNAMPLEEVEMVESLPNLNSECLIGLQWHARTFDNFDDYNPNGGWGNWVPGLYAELHGNNYEQCNLGYRIARNQHCARLGQNSTGFVDFHTIPISSTGFRKVRVSFEYFSDDSDDGLDYFHVQLRYDQSGSWETIDTVSTFSNRTCQAYDREFVFTACQPDEIEARILLMSHESDDSICINNAQIRVGSEIPASETCSPTTSPTPSPTDSPTTSPSDAPTASPTTGAPTTTPTTGPPTSSPTKNPTQSPTVSPTKNPTQSPTSLPTTSPTTGAPTASPTTGPPTTSPTQNPSHSPTTNPTEPPTQSPTSPPTGTPTEPNPTSSPTVDPPTLSPSLPHTNAPTKAPSKTPTVSPTVSPVASPTSNPSVPPTDSPTELPSKTPTTNPTSSPSESPEEPPTPSPSAPPTITPTKAPSKIPTMEPTRIPTNPPTNLPTTSPTLTPTSPSTTSPSLDPTSNPTASPTTIVDEFTDRTWGNWIDEDADGFQTWISGNSDFVYCRPGAPEAEPVCDGSNAGNCCDRFSVRLRGSNSDQGGILPSHRIDVSNYSQVDVFFKYQIAGMESQDGFALYSSTGGTAYNNPSNRVWTERGAWGWNSDSLPNGDHSATVSFSVGNESDLFLMFENLSDRLANRVYIARVEITMSMSPTQFSTKAPSETPSTSPTRSPVNPMTPSPSVSPAKAPSRAPSRAPSISPSSSPTRSPTKPPMFSPSAPPTNSPTKAPSKAPTSVPTNLPTTSPTLTPTSPPTTSPSMDPTSNPTASPTTIVDEFTDKTWGNWIDEDADGFQTWISGNSDFVYCRPGAPEAEPVCDGSNAGNCCERFSVRLRGSNTGQGGILPSHRIDVSNYSQVDVFFKYQIVDMESQDGFALYSSTGGTAYNNPSNRVWTERGAWEWNSNSLPNGDHSANISFFVEGESDLFLMFENLSDRLANRVYVARVEITLS